MWYWAQVTGTQHLDMQAAIQVSFWSGEPRASDLGILDLGVPSYPTRNSRHIRTKSTKYPHFLRVWRKLAVLESSHAAVCATRQPSKQSSLADPEIRFKDWWT